MPVGTSLARADEKMKQVEAIIGSMPEIDSLSTQVGGDNGHNTAYVGIGLKPRHSRKLDQFQVEDEIRKRLDGLPGISVALGNRPIFISILGPDPTVLDQITADLGAKIKKVKGVTDFESSVKPGLPAYAVRVRPDAARQLGMTPPQLAASLRAYVQGDVSTYWTTPDGQQVEVQLRLPQASRESVAQLNKLPVAFAADGTPVALESVATIEPVTNPDVIKRQDLQRRQAVYAGVDAKSGRTVGQVNADIDKIVKATVLPPGYRFDVGGAAQDQDDIFGNIGSALGLALIFIYIVLASQFGSFLQPLAIMASLPLSLIGVMISLKLFHSTINLFSLIGLIMLMGLVTKNAILLVDFANHARKAGATLAEAGAERRPDPDAPDHHDHGRDGVRHVPARARARRRRRAAGADGPRHHRRRHHLDAADAGGGAGDLRVHRAVGRLLQDAPGRQLARRASSARCCPAWSASC